MSTVPVGLPDQTIENPLYQGVIKRHMMKVEIPLMDSAMHPHTNFTDDEINTLIRILDKLRFRDFDITIPGWHFDGVLERAGMLRKDGELFAILDIQL